ncbi:hypothetical protein [Lysobacter gummosus]
MIMSSISNAVLDGMNTSVRLPTAAKRRLDHFHFPGEPRLPLALN